MEKEGKKYLIKESELKEIAKEMLLMELYNPDDFKGLHTQRYKGPAPNVGELVDMVGNIGSDVVDDAVPQNVKDWLIRNLGIDIENLNLGRGGNLPSLKQIFGNFDQETAQNKDAHEILYVNKACEWISKNAFPQYDPNKCGNCARYVKLALRVGGLGIPYGMYHDYAYNYLVILPYNGWKRINISQAGQPGDVCVIAPCVDVAGNKHEAGHISMCVGNGVWVSDFVQKSIHGLAANPPIAAVYVFRYPNIK